MQGSRTKADIKAKVILEKVKNDATLSEISESVGIPTSTASDIITKELPEVRKSSAIIAKIIDNDREFLKLASTMGANKLRKLIIESSQGETLDLQELDRVVGMAEKIFKRFTLLQGKVTDDEGGLISKETQSLLDDVL